MIVFKNNLGRIPLVAPKRRRVGLEVLAHDAGAAAPVHAQGAAGLRAPAGPAGDARDSLRPAAIDSSLPFF